MKPVFMMKIIISIIIFAHIENLELHIKNHILSRTIQINKSITMTMVAFRKISIFKQPIFTSSPILFFP